MTNTTPTEQTSRSSAEPKSAQIRRLIARKNGATMTVLQKQTGWQAHSIRAVLSGLRKKGDSIRRQSNRRGESVYYLDPA